MSVRTLPRPKSSLKTAQLHVMVVEDEEMIVRLVTHMLAEDGCVTMTHGGTDVIALMNESLWMDVDVALVDLLLPGTTGDELFVWLAEHAPHVRRVAMSGAGPLRLAEVPSVHISLLKPFDVDELLHAIRP